MRKWTWLFIGLGLLTVAAVLCYLEGGISPDVAITAYGTMVAFFGLGYVCGMADEAVD